MKNIDKRTIDNLIESTRNNSSTGIEEICKRMGIAKSDVNLLLNSERNKVKKGK